MNSNADARSGFFDIPGQEHGIYERLFALHRVFVELDDRTAAFSRRAKIRCQEGCGICCSGFEPDITDLEAGYIAVYLLVRAPGLINRLTSIILQKACVFYDPDSLYHCTIYEARPLICRVFGFSASTGKNGQPEFAGCKFMPAAATAGFAAESLLETIPVMSDYGIRVSALSAGVRTAMRIELPRAISSVGLSMSLSALAETPLPDFDGAPEGSSRWSGAA